MALTLALVGRGENTTEGKVAYCDVTFDSSYPNTGGTVGEPLDLTASPFTLANNALFTTVKSVIVTEGPYDTDYNHTVLTTCCKILYHPAASRAVATGTLRAYVEDGTSGVTTQVANATNLAAVLCRIKVIGS